MARRATLTAAPSLESDPTKQKSFTQLTLVIRWPVFYPGSGALSVPHMGTPSP